MVDKSKEEEEIIRYAEGLATKVLEFKKNKKYHLVFLKQINDLLAFNLDLKDLAELEKEISNQYNNKLKENHKKKKTNVQKVNMKEDADEEDMVEYGDDEDDTDGFNYKKFKK